jgi:hypothetical protein
VPVLTCGWCGAVLRQADTGRRRRFCDTRCRVAAFRRERDAADYPEAWQRKALAEGWKPPAP